MQNKLKFQSTHIRKKHSNVCKINEKATMISSNPFIHIKYIYMTSLKYPTNIYIYKYISKKTKRPPKHALILQSFFYQINITIDK